MPQKTHKHALSNKKNLHTILKKKKKKALIIAQKYNTQMIWWSEWNTSAFTVWSAGRGVLTKHTGSRSLGPAELLCTVERWSTADSKRHCPGLIPGFSQTYLCQCDDTINFNACFAASCIMYPFCQTILRYCMLYIIESASSWLKQMYCSSSAEY